ncbi:SCO family protein [Brevibacillus daliensis]|uniref:SCO family protein n=1 Tax=Brevibacillus daliensis TaxID=2892995 RepID=UPI001E64EC2B|nr:SCO family protein [Brevibacillus daliensis]
MDQHNLNALYLKWIPLASILIIVLVLGMWGYRYYYSTADIPVIKQMQDFTLERMDGQEIKLSDSNGKVRLVSFIFTRCPDVCPLTTQIMVDMQEEFKEKGLYGKDVEFISITFDYENDTPEVLQQYATAVGADATGWQFLRGPDDVMKPVLEDFWIGAEKQKDGMYVHTMKTFLIDKEMNMRQVYGMAESMQEEKDKIMHEIRKLSRE